MVVNSRFNEQCSHVRLYCMVSALLISVIPCEAYTGGVRLVDLDGNRAFCDDLPKGVPQWFGHSTCLLWCSPAADLIVLIKFTVVYIQCSHLIFIVLHQTSALCVFSWHGIGFLFSVWGWISCLGLIVRHRQRRLTCFWACLCDAKPDRHTWRLCWLKTMSLWGTSTKYRVCYSVNNTD